MISISHNSLLFSLAAAVGIDLKGFKIHILFLTILNLKTLVLVGLEKGFSCLTRSLALRCRADAVRCCKLRILWVLGLPRGLVSPVLPSLLLAWPSSVHLASHRNVPSAMKSSGPLLCPAKGHWCVRILTVVLGHSSGASFWFCLSSSCYTSSRSAMRWRIHKCTQGSCPSRFVPSTGILLKLKVDSLYMGYTVYRYVSCVSGDTHHWRIETTVHGLRTDIAGTRIQRKRLGFSLHLSVEVWFISKIGTL